MFFEQLLDDMFRNGETLFAKFLRNFLDGQIGPVTRLIHGTSCRVIANNLEKYSIDVFYGINPSLPSTTSSADSCLSHNRLLQYFFSPHTERCCTTAKETADILLSAISQFHSF